MSGQVSLFGMMDSMRLMKQVGAKFGIFHAIKLRNLRKLGLIFKSGRGGAELSLDLTVKVVALAAQ